METEAISSITQAVMAASLVLLSLIAAYGVVLGHRIIKTMLQRESGFGSQSEDDMWVGWNRPKAEEAIAQNQRDEK